MLPSPLTRLTSTPCRRLVAVLGLSSAAGLAMSVFRAYYGGTLGYASLPWDLFLAWVPLPFAFAVDRLSSQNRKPWGRMLGLAFVWLLFFPNAPYLVTEYMHLPGAAYRVDRPLPAAIAPFSPAGQIPLWFDVLLISMYAWTGLLLGYVSLHRIHGAVRRIAGAAAGWAVVVAGTVLCAFGISLGRFQRWNSWDLFTRPVALMSDVLSRVLDPLAHPRTSAVTVVLAAFLLLGYLSLVAMMHLRGGEDETPGTRSAERVPTDTRS